ncbi:MULTISPECIES: aromatic ring-hydroxylating dioxygenase subunit alpha [Burkholderiaceae]|jgi:phenylpropionate dioxygenase-like ring-hydroxylating dioxygenase large terminal subunit|uniref:Aromatic ring-hydroxylating dioxygenase subunit alpha n=1 Tax=Paraburkholderia fungorum TaxID=134537 RepID=A0AAP5QKR4_9BURK|nr:MULTISPECIES: aromatic ring-hydroxylating dioxygenase subunit alpha [Burkholderiaceae]MDT8844012.1 aromatic ring-hydroxylating dioxygenase subunit alpha [Paraburkholderia fungorum]
MFLKNAWYVAAWDKEVMQSLLPVTILDEPIVLYRKADGTPVALEDACPHRKLPLSMGRLIGDDLECGYHGLTFDCSGACVKAPGSPRIPAGAQVRSYPLAERYGLVWIWMGDAQAADPDAIVQIEEWGNPAWGVNRGDAMTVDCHYLYVTDNLLDPSHVAWVHRSSFGNAACETEPLKTVVAENGVTVSRWMRDVEVAPFYAKFVKFAGNCDRKQHYEVRFPSHAIIKAIFTPAGTGGDDTPQHANVFVMNSYNFMTPVDDSHTRYYWFQTRNFDPDNAGVSRQFDEDVRHAFEEDRVILTAVHKGMAGRRSSNIDLAIDSGPLRFRRALQQMIEREQAAGPASVPVYVVGRRQEGQ